MLNRISFLEEARDDLELGKDFYDEIESGLGDDFISSMLSEISLLKFRFGLHKEEFGLHRVVMKSFPFLTYYKAEGNNRKIVAILDSRGDERTRKSLLENRRAKKRK